MITNPGLVCMSFGCEMGIIKNPIKPKKGLFWPFFGHFDAKNGLFVRTMFTNDKKKQRKRQEKLKLKSKEMLKSDEDNREILKDMCAKKRQDFFNKLGGMTQKNEVDKNMKRKRDAEVQQQDNQYKKKTKVEENLGENNEKSDASKFNSNFKGGQENLKRNTARSEMNEDRAS